jgi:predicted aspartyl protease
MAGSCGRRIPGRALAASALLALFAFPSIGAAAPAAHPTPQPRLPGVLTHVRKVHPKPTPPPSLNDVLTRANAAAQDPASARGEIEQWGVTMDGLSGSQAIVRRGKDFVSVTHLGPFVTARGRVGSRDWHQDENGITVIDPTPSDRLVGRSLERVSEPIEAYAVLETYASGRERRSFYDPKTFELERRERWAGGRYSYSVWDDFRPDGAGGLQAWHSRGEDADGNAFDYRMRSERVGVNVEDAALQVPRNRHAVVQFPPTTRVARLPATFEEHRVHVRVVINRQPLDFLLDSGASGIVIASDVARRIHLEGYGSGRGSAAGSFASSRVIAPLIEVGALRMHDTVIRTAPIVERGSGDSHIAWLLGFDFIATTVLRIDYVHETVDAYEPSAFSARPGATSLEVGLGDQIPSTTVQVDEASADHFLLDTGAATSLLLFSRFARAHPADTSDDGVGAALAQTGIGLSAYGVGGRIATRPVHVKRVTVAGVALDDRLVYVAESPHALGFDAADGVVGAHILARLGTIVLDYGNSRILIEPTNPKR